MCVRACASPVNITLRSPRPQPQTVPDCVWNLTPPPHHPPPQTHTFEMHSIVMETLYIATSFYEVCELAQLQAVVNIRPCLSV